MSNIVLIVDPFSTGKMYAAQFSLLGYECYAILSGKNVPDFFQKTADFTDFKVKHFLSPDKVKQQFLPQHIKAVVIGAETGVFVGEHLADYFQVKGNSPQSSLLRRDKFAMQNQLKNVGLDYINTQLIYNGQDFPVFKDHAAYILKPLNSAGT